MAGSAFVVLVDIFFVSIVAPTGGPVVFGVVSVVPAGRRSAGHKAGLQRVLVLVVVVFYGSALGRAWEVTGITRRR